MTNRHQVTQTSPSDVLRVWIGLGLCVLLSGQPLVADETFSPEQLDFFESKIRPVLVAQCYSCHSEEEGESEGGLFLDSRQGMRIGGSSGAAVVPGKPEQSLLLKALRYQDDDLQMPPEDAGGKLEASVIADFASWIEMGAPDPRSSDRVPPARDMETAATHWAFQPIRKPSVPATDPLTTQSDDRIGHAVDAFIVQKLHARGLSLNPIADRRTLLRRLALDLTGLPPTYEQVVAFEQDRDADALEKVVDRLLDSPGYGERWARHWLDVARYADTRGYLAGGLQERYAFSHTYRDYVIRAFNEDKPYNQFVLEQLAADQLELGDDQHALAAMGFLTLGRRFINNTHLIIDDRIDVTTRGLMGLTVACARCHDHKFDPIPTADYYSLHGVFASSREPDELPLLESQQDGPQYDSFVEARRQLEKKMDEIRDREIDSFLDKQQRKLGDYLLAAHQVDHRNADKSYDDFAGERQVDARILRRWQEWLQKPADSTDPHLSEWLAALQRFAPTTDNANGGRAGESEDDTPSLVRKSFQSSPPQSLQEAAQIYNQLAAQAMDAKSDNDDAAVLVAFLRKSPCTPDRDEVGNWIRRHVHNQTAGLRREVEALNWTHEGAPTRAHVLVDQQRPQDSHILQRGNPGSPGEVVPRRYLEVLSGGDRTPFRQGSGRLELAQRIASGENPLTARVFVNRVWGWHFGQPLVDTPSDFGVRTPEPEHLKLLNWLAADFIEHDWSIKHLHRRIVHSRTYQQSSHVREQAFQSDPDNRLLHHFHRRRLGFEGTRDSLLAVSGELDTKLGGLPVDITKQSAPPRRTIYAFIERQNLPGLFRTFDFPSPDASVPRRFATTVPQQGLFLLNSHFAAERARSLAKRVARIDSDQDRIRQLYHLVFQRDPSDRELALGVAFVTASGSTEKDQGLGPWDLYCQTLMLSSELVFIN